MLMFAFVGGKRLSEDGWVETLNPPLFKLASKQGLAEGQEDGELLKLFSVLSA